MTERSPQRIIGESPALSDLLDQVSQVAPLNRPVLVIGERGTGKELVAERLHYLSQRWEQPFLKINCGAISESLLDADLFGYEPGAFTGANRIHKGRFERAHEGTLFLDEVGNMSQALQEKLLRIIEYGEFERLGGQKTLTVDVRIIAATNEHLPALAQQGKFRLDLLDRLAFDVLTLPPLRVRQGDVRLLAEQFGIQMSTELGWSMFPGFTEQAMDELLQHPFHGNVRELKNAIERSVYRWGLEDEPIDDLVLDPFDSPWQPRSDRGSGRHHIDPSLGFGEQVARLEVQLLQQALDRHDQHQGKAADALGLTYHQFRSQLRKHGLIGQGRPKSD
ncbi:phage shock protein operon transcriptional activator [Saccharospirillum salsuginis]|uniref:PSP operon transcriptional activator n=1 Tax=Saccharospirillum salsuginis TaxID=418750 RepID=A0A918KTK5_9GAMM|nr:phage shock protein operon transcriptional activator [Saccharospirillum salsuginis]GGX76280.1 PSP operon transcriptional activator [Saccharospirillum salsuginis]